MSLILNNWAKMFVWLRITDIHVTIGVPIVDTNFINQRRVLQVNEPPIARRRVGMGTATVVVITTCDAINS